MLVSQQQFLTMHSGKTMLQQTVEWLSDLHASESITICDGDHRFSVAELREIGALGKIVLENAGRNTLPVIA